MKSTARPPAPAAAAKQLKGFIDKFDDKNQAVIRATRRALRRLMPSANELVYDNYNFFVIGYCPTERPTDCVVSIAAARTESGCRSTTARPCRTRTSFCSAVAARIDSSGFHRRRS